MEAFRNTPDGTVWMTIRQAAAWLGRDVQTIYGWERRGHLTGPCRDEYGRKIYTQQQLAEAERKVRANVARQHVR